MELMVWLMLTIPIGIFFICFGIYAWKRKKPMWFWSGKEVKESEISDIPAYNRANGIMWLCFSAIFWLAAVLGAPNSEAAGKIIIIGSVAGIPLLYLAYRKIYSKYKCK